MRFTTVRTVQSSALGPGDSRILNSSFSNYQEVWIADSNAIPAPLVKGMDKSMRKAKKNIGSKNGVEKACKSGDFTKETKMRSIENELYSSDWSKLGLFGKMNSMSTNFMLNTSFGSKRFYDKFASEDQCAENPQMLSILTSCH
ncbi:hypothetical protein PIB30_023224 [Stylosanthes scabra]|uniref:Uncharacterized protein n=1 Tax=Stylosanthes scabra TaxID=79078 RepID=A0ABU6WCZ0_9FABA|nr:hypothetical protein [Stylosanthes scabra]